MLGCNYGAKLYNWGLIIYKKYSNMKKIDGPIKKPGKKSGLGFLNLVNEAYKE